MDVFAAVADSARRDVISALAESDLNAGELADLFPISRPAVSRHLRVLREAGLVRDELVGRHRVYRLEVQALAPVAAWLTSLPALTNMTTGPSPSTWPDPPGRASPPAKWSTRLDALETEVRRTRRERRSAPTDRSAPPADEETA